MELIGTEYSDQLKVFLNNGIVFAKKVLILKIESGLFFISMN